MAVTRTPAAFLRLVPIFHLLLIIFSLPGQSHTSMIPKKGAVINPPSIEELTTSLVVNQLAILQLMQDASDASSVAAEKCGQNETRLEEEAKSQAARLEEALRRLENEARSQTARLEEALRRLERVEEVVKAEQQHSTQDVLEAISTNISTIAQDMLTIAAEKCRQNEARLENETRVQATRLEEALELHLERMEKVVEAAVPPPPVPTPQCTCEEGWVRLDSSCYHINSITKLNWGQSRDYCLSQNSDLVKITSGHEQSFIRQHLTNSVWIGLTDVDSEGRFVWTDGSKPVYTAWSNIEPNDSQGTEDCVEMRQNSYYAWNDLRCSDQLGFVCEKPLGRVSS